MFDTLILLIVGYSCITSVMYISFGYAPEKGTFVYWLDIVVVISFATDFFLKFFEEYQDRETF